MARALSEDLRSQVLQASLDGLSARQAAARFRVPSGRQSRSSHPTNAPTISQPPDMNRIKPDVL
jgi:hypothetical protein